VDCKERSAGGLQRANQDLHVRLTSKAQAATTYQQETGTTLTQYTKTAAGSDADVCHSCDVSRFSRDL